MVQTVHRRKPEPHKSKLVFYLKFVPLLLLALYLAYLGAHVYSSPSPVIVRREDTLARKDRALAKESPRVVVKTDRRDPSANAKDPKKEEKPPPPPSQPSKPVVPEPSKPPSLPPVQKPPAQMTPSKPTLPPSSDVNAKEDKNQKEVHEKVDYLDLPDVYWRPDHIDRKCKELKEKLGATERRLLEEYAVLVIDLWDKHWCDEVMPTANKLACRMAMFVPKLRSCGVPVIFSPGDELISRYNNHEARELALKAPEVAGLQKSKKVKRSDWPTMPTKSWFSDRDGGCTRTTKPRSEVWTRIHPDVSLEKGDFVASDSIEILRILRWTRKKGIIFVGQHTNLCIALSRQYSLLRFFDVGVPTAFVPDMTDSIISKKTDPHIKNRQHLADLYSDYFVRVANTTVVDSSDLFPGMDEEYNAEDCGPW